MIGKYAPGTIKRHESCAARRASSATMSVFANGGQSTADNYSGLGYLSFANASRFTSRDAPPLYSP
jgi:hypothetical protein